MNKAERVPATPAAVVLGVELVTRVRINSFPTALEALSHMFTLLGEHEACGAEADCPLDREPIQPAAARMTEAFNEWKLTPQQVFLVLGGLLGGMAFSARQEEEEAS